MKKSLYCLSLMTVLFLAALAQAVPVQSDLVFHYRADFLTYADGAEVTSWADACATAPNATMSARSGYGTPNFVADAYNGFPAVRFERHPGTDNTVKTCLESATYTFSATTVPASSLVTVFIVAKQGFTGFTNRTFHIGERNNNANNCLEIDLRPDADGVGGVGMGARTNGGRACAITSFTAGEWHISATRIQDGQAINPTNYKLWRNNVPVSMYGSGSTMDFLDDDADTVNMMGFGVNSTNGILDNETYEGDIAEVLVYKYLSDENVTAVYNFLYNKYNNLMAHNPTPAKQTVDQGSEVVQVGSVYRTKLQLGWDTGHQAAGSETPNPAIQKHYVYWAESEPNLYAATNPNMIVTAGSNTTGDILLEPGTKHYWRVDHVWVGAEPNQITGDVWTVTPLRATPKVTTQPRSIQVLPGEEAWMEPVILSPSTPSFQWYKTPDNSTTTTTDDIAIAAPAGTQQRLSINPAQVEHEGYYFCVITNAAGSQATGVRMIGIKRQMAHYQLNSLVSGQYADSSTADSTVLPVTPSVAPGSVFVDSAYPELGQALNLVGTPSAAGVSAPVWTSAFTDSVTVSAWVKWSGVNGQQQGIACNESSILDTGGTANNKDNWYLETRSDNGNLQFNTANTANLQGTNLPIGQWKHVVGTIGPNGHKLYVDGVLVASGTSTALANRNITPIYLGCSDRDSANVPIAPFNGVIDDVQIFNYQKDLAGVIDLYTEYNTGAHFCINKDNLDMRFDNNADCFVNMTDFVEFASDWLTSGVYPNPQ